MTDYTPEEFAYYLDLAAALKKDKKEGKEIQTLKGKNFALIFEKDSTRTRCAFEVAARDQRAFTTYLGPTGSQIGKKESIADTARVLASMVRWNRIQRLQAVRCRRTRSQGRRSRLERPHRLRPPDTDPRQFPDTEGTFQ